MERAPLHLLDIHHGLSLFSSSDTCNVWTHTGFWTKQWAILSSPEYVISNWFCGHKPWSPCSQMGCFCGVCPYSYCASAASTPESVWGICSVSPEKLSSTLAVLLDVVSRGKPVLSSPGTPVAHVLWGAPQYSSWWWWWWYLAWGLWIFCGLCQKRVLKSSMWKLYF